MCMAPLLDRLRARVALPGDTPEMVLRKGILCLVWGLLSLFGVVTITFFLAGVSSFSVTNTVLLIQALYVPIPFIHLLATRRYSKGFVCVWVVYLVGSVLAVDVEQMAKGRDRAWPFLIIVADVSMLLALPDGLLWLIFGTVVIWEPFLTIEREKRVFLLDRVGVDDTYCSCDTPPCPEGFRASVRHILFVLSIFIFDFLLTRKFAKGMTREKERMQAAVALSGEIAESLAKFDLPLASEFLLHQKEALPPALFAAYTQLISNLQSYRPYLPDSCLVTESSIIEQPPSEDSMGCDILSDSTVSNSSALLPSRPVQRKRITILVAAIRDYLSSITENLPAFQRSWMEFSLCCVRKAKGTLEDFKGDTVVALFNGARSCTSQSENALRCAREMTQNGYELWIGVVGGKAICGDFGNDEVRKYSVIGEVVGESMLMSRLAKAWCRTILTSSVVLSDSPGAFYAWLLLEQVVFEGRSSPQTLYEVLDDVGTELCGQEWMYQLDLLQATDPCQANNKVVELIHSNKVDAARKLLREMQHEQFVHQSGKLHDILREENFRIPLYQVRSIGISRVDDCLLASL